VWKEGGEVCDHSKEVTGKEIESEE